MYFYCIVDVVADVEILDDDDEEEEGNESEETSGFEAKGEKVDESMTKSESDTKGDSKSKEEEG